MTDSQPPKATPARKPAAKATTSADAPAAKKPAAAKPATTKPAAAKPATPRTRTAKPKAEAAPAAFAPVEPVAPATSAPAAAATAPAGWYPVAAGSATQRYWDGTAWTEHIHDPATAAAAATTTTRQHEQLHAAEGTSPNTLWIWFTVGSMAVAIAYWIVTAIYWATLVNVNLDYEAATANQWADPLYLVSFGLGFLSTALMIVFPILDWVVLRKRAVPKPFHWAWSLFALVVGSPAVYVIGRSVVAKRRTGKGLAPLWVFIALQVVLWVVAIIAIVAIVAAAVAGFLSIFNDAGNVL